jgi:FAD/FMN-containing dehydrogenase
VPLAPVWTNYAGNQPVFARCVVRPRTLEELVDIVRDVGSRRGRLRPVATGLSFSDVLQTDDTLAVLTDMLSDTRPFALLSLEEFLWRERSPAEPRVRVAAGARIRELNAALARAGLAFENLGGYDGQTFVGAFSTSTHGSGVGLGPLSAAVRSLDLVTTGGAVLRVEPANGITDPDAFRRHHRGRMTLIQDEGAFQSCVVSLGCMGIIHSAVVAVRPAYRLVEHKTIGDWSRVKATVASAAALGAFRHYEVLINPYPRRDGDHTCLVTERQIAPPDAAKIPVLASVLSETDLTFMPSTQQGIVQLFNGDQRVIPEVLEVGLRGLATPSAGHLDDSYAVFNLGKINSAKVLSGEYFVPQESAVRAVEILLGVIADNRRSDVFHTSPLALRFTAPADAHLSMSYGRLTCTIEAPMYTHARGALEAILSYESALSGLGGRPHWGQINQLTGSRGWLRSAYPMAERWLGTMRRLNSKGTFDNAFTDRLGISVSPRRASCAG